MLKPILSVASDNCNEKRAIWEDVDDFWFCIRRIRFSLDMLESYLSGFEVSYINSSRVEDLERFMEYMFQVLGDQFINCSQALAQLDLYQDVEDVEDIEDSDSDLISSDTLDTVCQLEVVDDVVWKEPNGAIIYQTAWKAVKAGRRYVEDLIKFVEAFSLQHF